MIFQNTMERCSMCRLLVVTLVFWLFAAETEANGEIAYRLKWLINASTVGDVYALDQGFFDRENLAVVVKSGGPERDAIRELELGYAQFGVASADQVMRALDKGAPVVVLAQLFQINPLQWIYRAGDFTLATIQDLVGKKVGITYGGNDETIMRALLASAGLNEKQVHLTGVRYDYTPFLRNRVPIWPVYRNTQGIFLMDKLNADGEHAAFFDPSTHGIRFVANSLVTSRNMVKQHEQTVNRFTRALLAGWRAAMKPENEPVAIRILATYDRDTSKEVIGRQLAITRQMVRPETGFPIGRIDRKAWMQTERIMLRQRLISRPVNVHQRFWTETALVNTMPSSND